MKASSHGQFRASRQVRIFGVCVCLMHIHMAYAAPSTNDDNDANLAFVQQPQHDLYPLKVQEIKAMRAETYNSPFEMPDVPPFEVPPKWFDEVLGCFEPAEPDSSPRYDKPEILTLTLRFKDGRFRRICVYCGVAGDPIAFSIHGKRFRRRPQEAPAKPVDEALKLDGILRRCFFETTGLDASTLFSRRDLGRSGDRESAEREIPTKP